jgi:tetratricopeptide (TPR) repeat protein
MSKRVIIGVISVVCLMMGCTGRKYAEMQERLHQLDAFNQSDSVFRSTTEAKALADYFDDHGTPNEQMLAYYLLGRAYHDLHESPMALKYFQMASERADTTAEDCDYRQLSRVYGQMSNVFYQQGLYEQTLVSEDKCIQHAWRSKDTLTAVRGLVGKTIPYIRLHHVDSAINVCKYASDIALKYGDKEMSAAILGAIIGETIALGNLDEAKAYMDRYEAESGYFGSDNNIERGRETYYYTKGNYFLAIDRYDSAEYYFRKELKNGKDFNNQNAGSRGLALLYQKVHRPDSAAKYALYSYAMNDSVYAQMATKEVEQVQGMYDYSRNQDIAQKERERAEKEHGKVKSILIVFGFFVLVVVYCVRVIYRKRQEIQKAYSQKISEMAKLQVDIVKLRSLAKHTEELDILIEEKEMETKQMANEIESLKEKLGLQKMTPESILEESDIYIGLQRKAAKAIVLSNDDWLQVNAIAIKVFPNFYKFISSKKYNLNDKEFKTCILIRMHFVPKDIANMLGVSQAYITKIRNNMMPKLFGIDGNSKKLDERLMQFM